MARGMQRIQIIGNVGRDPESRVTPSGVKVCDFSVAVDLKYGETTRTTWFKVTCWRQLAEIAAQYVRSGAQVYVDGKIDASAYIGQDGAARASLDLTADNLLLLGGRQDTGESNDLPF